MKKAAACPGEQTAHKQKTMPDSETKMGSLTRGLLPSVGVRLSGGAGETSFTSTQKVRKSRRCDWKTRESGIKSPSNTIPGQQIQKAIPAQSLKEEMGVLRQKARR